MKKIIVSISFLMIFFSCQQYRKRDLSDRISFMERICENDSASFFIQHIKLLDVERNADIQIGCDPDINLRILIKNKLDRNLGINTFSSLCRSNFVGILRERGDTIYFLNGFHGGSIAPGGDTIVSVTSFIPFSFDYDEGGDNTDLMLSFLEQMDFYYIPLVDHKQDTNAYYLCREYCLGLSPKTKVSSLSKIRVK